MLDKDALERLLDYTVWANHRVMRAAPPSPSTTSSASSAPATAAIRGTLAHIMWAEWIWLERWKGVSPHGPPDEAEFADVVALRDRWTVIEDHRARVAATRCRDAGAGEIIRYKTTAGVPYEAPLWQLVQHVANHSTYHRGQVTSLLRQVGGRAVPTDMVVYDRERRGSALEGRLSAPVHTTYAQARPAPRSACLSGRAGRRPRSRRVLRVVSRAPCDASRWRAARAARRLRSASRARTSVDRREWSRSLERREIARKAPLC